MVEKYKVIKVDTYEVYQGKSKIATTNSLEEAEKIMEMSRKNEENFENFLKSEREQVKKND